MIENIFIKIINREIPADIVWESDDILAFRDIAPKAKTHILVIPKKVYRTADDVPEAELAVFGTLFGAARIIAQEQGLDGYKLAMNVGESGGQVVPHVHLHLLSGDYSAAV